MSRAKRILLVATMLVASVNAVHAGLFRKAPKPAQTAATSVMTLTSVSIDGARILLHTSGAPVYTSYSPSPDVFVVDLTSTSRDAALTIPSALPTAVSSIAAEDVTEMGNRLTRVTFRLSQPMAPEATGADNAVVILLPVTAIPIQTAEAAPAEVAPVAAAVIEEPAPRVESLPAEHEVVEPVAVAESLPLPKAKMVRRIDASANDGNVDIRIAADGDLSYKAFRLENPSRLVIDLDGVKNNVAKSAVKVDDAVVKGVRVGQFKTAPSPVARVVIDLARKADYHIEKNGDTLRVAFGNVPALPPMAAETTAAPLVTERPAPPAEPAASTITVAEVAPPKSEPAPVRVSEPAPKKSADVPAQVPTIAEDAPAWKMPAPATASKGARAKITAPEPQVPPARPAEDVFTDTAQQPQTNAGTSLSSSRTSAPGHRQFTGEPLSLNLKDADIKDVLRTFAQLTGLNIAVDPGVTGSVTVDFVDVPWDQALDIILRQNGLTFTIEGNVMRVGTIERIAAETAASRRLAEEERLNVPLTTLSFNLSYARATDVAGLLREIASPRARILVDARTNQLIISEIGQYLQTMQNMIQTLDVPARQVVIEARIVESSKSFVQQYGFSWGFEGVLDPTVGTGTGLVFPNRVGFEGGPFSFTGGAAPVLGVHLSDVLGTFSLDFALHAFESQGFVRVISAPRVTTQDNSPAEIQSGFQIPYQTRVNFTTTVTYLDATLRLSVTPQITQSGTVIMDIQVQKNEPAVGLTIEGAAGTPLTTRQARTRLMVRDGGTAVIAGIFQTKDNDAQTRLPFVHAIPVLGNLFKSHNINTSHDELLIFITPKIVRG
ncbi:MAG TPA: type IV pilus secretin PilQ [Thermoanaerobaculia bacterium]|nr:type IV pilus secretin PilQ [Thermoanaerobaculia bacterium]